MASEFMAAIDHLAEEKGIPKEAIIETIEAALAAAYRKDFGQKEQIVVAELDPKTEKTRLFVVHKIVEEVEDPMKEISLKDAKKIDKKAKLEGEIREEVKPPAEYGRVAAQTAKQVVLQRLREAERNIIFQEYKEKEGTMITGTVQRIEGDVVMIDLGKTTGILFPSEQSRVDKYYVGQRMKLYLVKVDDSGKDPQVLLSRTHPDMVKQLFEMEVPEITSETVEIKGVAREAGVRSKVAVYSNQEAVDPVGSLVGRRGVRVQAVMAEIGDEKIDIVLWDEDQTQYIINALSPAKIKKVVLDEKNKSALIKVEEDQLSLAIGKSGQNVRLASKLTGWSIEVEKGAQPIKKVDTKGKEDEEEKENKEDKLAKKEKIEGEQVENKEEIKDEPKKNVESTSDDSASAGAPVSTKVNSDKDSDKDSSDDKSDKDDKKEE